jgi:HlyD family secretion protein
MDRPIEKRKWTPRRIAAYAAAGLTSLTLLFFTVDGLGKNRLNVDPSRLSLAQVKLGKFEEYVPISGKVQPITTVYLDLEEGGNAEKIYIRSGTLVQKGALILSLSNTTAQKQNIEAETRLIDNLNQLRNSKIDLTTSNLILRDQLLDLEYRITDLDRLFKRYQQLVSGPDSAVSREQFENARDQLAYLKDKRVLLQARIQRETELQQQQSKQIDTSIERANRNLELMSRIVESLDVRAPVAGYLSSLSAEIGQSFQRGQRVGQIDQLESFKVQADIDEFYITRIAVGQKGTFEFDGKTHELRVIKVYPEVTKDVFQADLEFSGGIPDGIKRGQTLQIDLSLSESKTASIVENGAFYRYTNGRWAYLVSDDGRSARRTEIRLGRQNPQWVEVLEGLEVGQKIIASNYDSFNDVDVLTFPEPLRP